MLNVEEYADSIILPTLSCHDTSSITMGGVYFKKEYIELSRRRYKAPYIDYKNIIHKNVIYGGDLLYQFGHFLLESLSRFWYIKNSKLPIVFTYQNKLKAYQEEILDMLNLKNEIIFLDVPTKFDNVIIPEPGYILNHYFSDEHSASLQIYEARPIIKGKKLYISRSKLHNSSGGYINEKSIENLFRNNGFDILHPQEHTVKEQLCKISQSEFCAGIEGSAFHSVVLIKNLRTKFFILPRMHYPDYGIIAKVNNLHFYNIKCERKLAFKSKLNWTHDKYECDINSLAKAIATLRTERNFYRYFEVISKDSNKNVYHRDCDKLNRLYFYAKFIEEKILPFYEILKEKASYKLFIEYSKICIEKKKNLRNCIFIYKWVLNRNDCWGDVHFFISKIYFELKRFSYSEKYARKAVDTNKKRILYIEWLCFILRRNKKFAEILSLLSETGISNEFAAAYYYKAISYSEIGKLPDAIKNICNAIRICPERILYNDTLQKLRLKFNANFDRRCAMSNTSEKINFLRSGLITGKK